MGIMRFSEEVCKAFHQQAAAYEKAAVVQREIGERLFERLSYLKIKPKYVLDLGCGTGIFSKKLQALYPDAVIVSFDIAHNMLLEVQKKAKSAQNIACIRGDMQALPFVNHLFDLVFSNQVLHWTSDWQKLASELNRVMQPDACLMFSTLGPDTFLELRAPNATGFSHANAFMDMHHMGDILLAEQFLDPVVDMEMLTLHYDSPHALFRALKNQGVRNVSAQRNPGLTGRKAWAAFEASVSAHQTETGKYPLTYEVVYGHAWRGAVRNTGRGVETVIPISALRRR